MLAWKTFHRHDRGASCRAWLFGILSNFIRRHRRQRLKWLRRKTEGVSGTELPDATTVAPTLNDGDIVAALDYFPVEFHEVLLLVDVEEFSYKETGEILRIPIDHGGIQAHRIAYAPA